MNLKVLYLGLLIVSASIGYGQSINPTESIVVFDPLFWRDQLKLDAFQCKKIKEINSEYYEQLFAVIREESDHKSVQVKATQSLLQRSEEIWETFHPRQRKRWKRMWQQHYLAERTYEI